MYLGYWDVDLYSELTASCPKQCGDILVKDNERGLVVCLTCGYIEREVVKEGI